jgi:hypothetical protein
MRVSNAPPAPLRESEVTFHHQHYGNEVPGSQHRLSTMFCNNSSGRRCRDKTANGQSMLQTSTGVSKILQRTLQQNLSNMA